MGQRKRKSIRDIQKALLTTVDGGLASKSAGPAEGMEVDESSAEGCCVELSPESYADLSLQAAHQGCTVEALAEMAVGDLLALRHWQLKAAREKQAQGKAGESCASQE